MAGINRIGAFFEKSGDSYDVPQGARNAAKRGLELRRKVPKSKKAGLDTRQAAAQGIGSGVARARDLISGRVSKESIKRMHRYFSRHAKNYKLEPGKKPEDDKGYQAGLLWGGEAGKIWAARMVARFKREEMEKGREHAFPIGTKRKHGKVMKVKTFRGWVPVKRLNRERTRIGHIPISHKTTALVSKKLLDPWYTHPKTKEMSEELPWITDVNTFHDPDDPRPNQLRMYARNDWRPMHEWLKRNPPPKFPSEQQFSKKIKDVTGKTFDVEFTLRVDEREDMPGNIKGTAQRLQDNKAVVTITLKKKYAETTKRLDVEKEVRRVAAHEIAHVMDPQYGKNYVAPERHYGAYINSPGEIRARLVEVTRDLLDYDKVTKLEFELQDEEKIMGESFRSRPQFVMNPEAYLFQSPTYSRVQRYLTDENNKKFLKLSAAIITAVADDKVGVGILPEVTKATKVPKKYLSGLSSSAKKERKAEIRRRAKDKDTAGYRDLPGDKGAKTKPSKYSRTQLAAKVRKETKNNTDDEFLRAVAKFTGISKRILRQVHKRGAAAWASGHRPGATQVAWSRARVYSFATGGKTRRTADKDLWAKHQSKK